MFYPILWRSAPPLLADDLFSTGGLRPILRSFDAHPFKVENRSQLPPGDICETRQEYQLFIEIPGMSPDGIEVVAQNDLLAVRGKVRYQLQEGNEQVDYTLQECRFGRFERITADTTEWVRDRAFRARSGG